ncbi:proteasome activator subunit 4 [Tanacetum coccineum]
MQKLLKRRRILVKEAYKFGDPDSLVSLFSFSFLPFIKAKSEVSLEDVAALLEFGLQVFNASQDKLYAQVRWGNVLVRLLNKYRKKLTLKVEWRPFYDTMVHTHFTRTRGMEDKTTTFRDGHVPCSFLPEVLSPGSANEIWSEFSSLHENPWHNSAFEGSGFVRLFLPTNAENEEFYSCEWVNACILQWDSIPNCQFWNSQWAAILARVIKNYKSKDWEDLLHEIFSRFLNMCLWQVEVGRTLSLSMFQGTQDSCLPIEHTLQLKAIAKSIVYLLKPGSLAQQHFDKLVTLLELNEQIGLCLGQKERELIDRGQYSKNESLSDTVAAATSILSYVEPSLVLPILVTRFHMALETMTATHQLKTAVTSVAFSGRSLFFMSLFASSMETDDANDANMFRDLLFISLANALLGMDANDPPKTLATMQLIGSIFSNMATLDDDMDTLAFMPAEQFSEWLDEFLCRLFSLLQHLEPSGVLNEDAHSPATSGTFLVEDGPRHTFILSNDEKKKIWKTVEKLLTDNQVREHAAAVLAGRMKGEDGDEASKEKKTKVGLIYFYNCLLNATGGPSIASIHGRVLALAACVLSVPYEMPRTKKFEVVNMGSCHGSLCAKDDTVKWYPDTKAQITVGVPMPPPLSTDGSFLIPTNGGIPTSRVTWKFQPPQMHRHMIIELDCPLLESEFDDAIRCSKVTIGASGSQQVEALGYEARDKVFADTDICYIQMEAPLYRNIGFKIPNLRVVDANGKWLEDRKVYKLDVYFHGGKED